MFLPRIDIISAIAIISLISIKRIHFNTKFDTHNNLKQPFVSQYLQKYRQKMLRNKKIPTTTKKPHHKTTTHKATPHRSLRNVKNFSTHHKRNQSPLEVYDDGVKRGLLKEDPRQRGTIVQLEGLYQRIKNLPSNYKDQFKLEIVKPEPPSAFSSSTGSSLLKKPSSFFGSMFGGLAAAQAGQSPRDPSAPSPAHHHAIPAQNSTQRNVENLLQQIQTGQLPSVKGLYIHGGVGCGKTMMMDMFFDQIPPNIPKVRKHFHSFMLEVHAKVHKIRTEAMQSTGNPATDPLPRIAKQFVEQEGVVLCLDEFQVTDVADAMILKELFSSIFACGGIVISTSNRAPDNLYYNGINRESFLPFIDLLKQRCDVVSMDAMVDYRTLVAQEEGLIHHPLNAETAKTMDMIYEKLHYGHEDQPGKQKGMVLDVAMGRNITIPRCVPKRVARFDFNELCDRALGAADYMAIAKEFPCLMVENIPILFSEDRMKLRRLITLLDVLYEHRTKVYLSTEAPLDKLFQPTASREDVQKVTQNQQQNNNNTNNNTTTNAKDTNNPLILAANQDEVFASARAMSRLVEMTSTTYLSGDFHTQGSKDTASKL